MSKNWYAVYTKSRAEKKVQLELEYQGIDHYLPIQKQLRQWSDRKKWVDTVLISGYIFVNITKFEYDKVLQTNGVVSYVKHEGQAATIPDEQIDAIKQLLRQKEIKIIVSRENFTKGDEVEVIAGPAMGTKGKLVSFKGTKKVCLQLDRLNISLLLEVPITEIQKIMS